MFNTFGLCLRSSQNTKILSDYYYSPFSIISIGDKRKKKAKQNKNNWNDQLGVDGASFQSSMYQSPPQFCFI